jgi:cyclase
MLRKRLIFTLIYADGYFHQSRNFRLQRVGNLSWLEKNYKFQQIAFSLDEIIILNASKKNKDVSMFAQTVGDLVKNVFIPVAAGGGIQTLDDAKRLFDHGADKIVLNSAFNNDPGFIEALVKKYGGQSIVAAVDCKKGAEEYEVFIQDGEQKLELSLIEHLERIEALGAGEVYLNSIDRDGTGFGYDDDLIASVQNDIKLPLIIAGGAGNDVHLKQGLCHEQCSAVATANLFNFIGNGLPNARKKLIEEGFNLANWG